MYTHIEITALHAPIFPKLVASQPHYVEIFYVEFYPNRTKNVENTGKTLLAA